MRLVTYEADAAWRAGIAIGDAVVDAQAAAREAGLTGADWSSNRALIAADAQTRSALATAAAELAPTAPALQSLRLGPPIPDPEKILCMGLNYRDHAEEAQLPLPEVPLFFAKFRNSLIGPNDEIVLPPAASGQVDYEAELAVVIGRRCRDVAAEQALDYVAGAMALNDVSARDLQLQVSQWMMGKAIDTFAPCGPALVTLDELGDLQDLGIRTRVNGETLQDAEHFADGVRRRRGDRVPDARDDARAGRHHRHRHARGRGHGARPAGLAAQRRRGRGRDRWGRDAAQHRARLAILLEPRPDRLTVGAEPRRRLAVADRRARQSDRVGHLRDLRAVVS
jgi:2-keto-4-pentenoate hydratase/2-oxohepta-3-ene-1,7-dioic acid hydratase in catechol pathway